MLSLLLIGATTIVCCILLHKFCHSGTHQQPETHSTIVNQVEQLLPQTQCGECGYAGCRPYAEAIVNAHAALTLCPPGGMRTANKLASLLGQTLSRTGNAIPAPDVARIDVYACIGCVKCIKACPVDAIVGAAKQLHIIIPELCTGCKLCIPPCPVDCISMEASQQAQWQWANPVPQYERPR